MKGIMIASAASHAGKTTATAAVLSILIKNKLNPSCFKVGPDFIDPMFHTFVSGKSSYNIKSYMMDLESVKYLFSKHSEGSDISIVEGIWDCTTCWVTAALEVLLK